MTSGLGLESMAHFVGGGMASLCSQSVIVPIDVISQRMMISSASVKTLGSFYFY